MRVHALSALSLVGLATTAAANQLDRRQQTTDDGSFACLSSIMALAEASPTFPAGFETATQDCVPATLTEAASSFASGAKAWYTSIANAISDCPAWPSGSTIPSLPDITVPACTGEQSSGAATATTTSTLGNAVATSTSPTTPNTHSTSTTASGTQSAATTSARSSAASGSAGRSATTSSSQSANAAARETGVVFAAVAMAAFGAAAL